MIDPGSRMENSIQMKNHAQNKNRPRVAGLDNQKPTGFELSPPAPARKGIAGLLNLLEIRKLRFVGQVYAVGDRDWALKGRLGATVSQPCVLTLAPVITRIDTNVKRLYLAEMELPDEADEEYEIPADDTGEALGQFIDPEAVMIEALSLALPLYPKVDGASLQTGTFTRPGQTPMSDEAARPFAGLTELRDKLKKDE